MTRTFLSRARQPDDEATSSNAVALSWLVMVRWAGLAAELGALFAGWRGLRAPVVVSAPAIVLTATVVSNLWLTSRLRKPPTPSIALGGWLVSGDVIGLSWLLVDAGGVLNPVSIFYLVDIVLAALVLGRSWTWVVTTLSVCGYGVLFLMPSQELRAARAMHPEIGTHIRGMWFAFAATALIIALLVARLATLVERRDGALAALRERRARDAYLVSLATLAAGAAHELSTPLGTIAVAARELERSIGDPGALRGDDVRLIRAEIERCRRVLQDMSARAGELAGEAPARRTLSSFGADVLALLSPDERARVDLALPSDRFATWPVGAVARALANLVRNGLQASPADGRVGLSAGVDAQGRVIVSVTDTGCGMSAAEQARAGEPFYTTKADGSGMGLGLFVAMSTIDQLGGTLALASAVGLGTTVTLTLPADAAPRAAVR